jgi:hypothetical protein
MLKLPKYLTRRTRIRGLCTFHWRQARLNAMYRYVQPDYDRRRRDSAAIVNNKRTELIL